MLYKSLILGVALFGALLLAACQDNEPGDETSPSPTLPTEFQGHTLDPPLPKPGFVLTDTSGNPYAFSEETANEVTLLYFGYTHCPDICPAHMADLAAVLDRHPDWSDHVNVVFVTVDPARDTPGRLKTWLGLFHEDFIGLRGTDAEVQEAADEALGPMAFPIETAAFGDGDYSVSHAAIVIAYGHDGVARVAWPFGTTQDEYENDLRILVEGD